MAKAFLRRTASQKGQQFVIECVTGGSYAIDAEQELRDQIISSYKQVLGLENSERGRQLQDIRLPELIGALEADNLIDRITHRRMAGPSEKKSFLKLKGTQQQIENRESVPIADPNPRIGFKCTHYSVTESSGFVEVSIIKKVPEEILFFVRTIDDSATAPDDYEHLDQLITMGAAESHYTLKVKVIDDCIWEPDKDFHIDICED